ncbi:MAG: hypothetical protein ACREK1_11270, partial [Longimicrobiales bacterium]
MSLLIDDVSKPSLRQHIGRLLSSCSAAEIAVRHIRLAALDLTERETGSIERCRILIGRLEVRSLTDFGFDDPDAPGRLRALRTFLESGRVEVRGAGLDAWSPDFSVYRGLSGAVHRDARPRGLSDAVPDGACLIGAHYFREPPSHTGPSFTALMTDPQSVGVALARFEALWERSHDVLEPLLSAVHQRRS